MKFENGLLGYGWVRNSVQFAFLITVIIIGFEFYHFSGELETGKIPALERPPGVEAFLPIGAMVSLKYYFLTGIVNDIHPSGLYMLGFILFVSLLFKKSFCSWICPVGFLSEQLAGIHRKIFVKGIRLPKTVDILLRSLKYLLLTFFLWSILYQMNIFVLKKFIYSSYNIISEFKMLKFFTDLTFTAGMVLGVLITLSILIKHFWCRYLCPYGGLLGFISLISPFKIRRNQVHCTSCNRCNRVCPSGIKISECTTVLSDECTGCGSCCESCPEHGVLGFSLPGGKMNLKPVLIACVMVVVFGGGSMLLNYQGKWQNSLQKQDYFYHLINQGLLDLKSVENPEQFMTGLDQKSRLELMRQMMQKK